MSFRTFLSVLKHKFTAFLFVLKYHYLNNLNNHMTGVARKIKTKLYAYKVQF